MNILVIDDDEMFREFLAEVLATSGHQPLLAADGASALAMLRLRAGAVDAVLLDANLQGMTCRATLLELQRLHPGLPVAMISGDAVSEVQRRFAGLPVAGFLGKPFEVRELTLLLEGLARRVAAARTLPLQASPSAFATVAASPWRTESPARASWGPSVSGVPGQHA